MPLDKWGSRLLFSSYQCFTDAAYGTPYLVCDEQTRTERSAAHTKDLFSQALCALRSQKARASSVFDG